MSRVIIVCDIISCIYMISRCYCINTKIIIIFCFLETCTKNEFHCGADTCIPSSWLCDGNADCLNGEDEHPKSGCGENGIVARGRGWG